MISIDPDPDVFRALRKLDVFTPSGQQQFAELCRTPQTVRVEGMPRNTRVAKVLVDADYRMKMVSQGTVKLPISSPFPSHHAAQLAAWRAAANRGENDAVHATNTRFWFEAGHFNFQGSSEADIAFLDGDTVFFDVAEVVLRDEDQRLEAKGLTASGKVNPVSRAFTCAWTQRMEDIYRVEYIWRDMHNIFRHFAVARVMVDRRAFTHVGFAASFLLDQYGPAAVTVPPTLPGLGRIDSYETHHGATTITNSPWVCGGISLEFAHSFVAKPLADEMRVVNRQVLAQRPAADAKSWVVK